MPSAEILAIGTELLLGQSLDTNTRFIAQKLQELGIDLFRTMIVGDNEERISRAIQEALSRADILITSGGLGPTVDDPTRNAVALATERKLEFKPELWEEIRNRFKRMNREPTENNRRQAFLPVGALAIQNPVGTAPAIVIQMGEKTIACLPGVPHEMKYILENSILPLLQKKYDLHEMIISLVLHASGLGESQIDELVADLEQQENPTLGLLAHHGQIDLRVTVKANDRALAERILQEQASLIRRRLGDAIYGEGDVDLPGFTAGRLHACGLELNIMESGLQGELIGKLKEIGIPIHASKVIDHSLTLPDLEKRCRSSLLDDKSGCTLGVTFQTEAERRHLGMVLLKQSDSYTSERYFGDNQSAALPWIVNIVLDFIRRHL
jgi:nicotinamide-nucleotide amidase